MEIVEIYNKIPENILNNYILPLISSVVVAIITHCIEKMGKRLKKCESKSSGGNYLKYLIWRIFAIIPMIILGYAIIWITLLISTLIIKHYKIKITIEVLQIILVGISIVYSFIQLSCVSRKMQFCFNNQAKKHRLMQYVLLVLPTICTEILFISMILGNDKWGKTCVNTFFVLYFINVVIAIITLNGKTTYKYLKLDIYLKESEAMKNLEVSKLFQEKDMLVIQQDDKLLQISLNSIERFEYHDLNPEYAKQDLWKISIK